MNREIDQKISRIIMIVIAGILLYWLYNLGVLVIDWLGSIGQMDSSRWLQFGHFCVKNISIILMVYVIICLQAAGIAEFRYRKNFVKAFFLAIGLTPLGMLIWCRRCLSEIK
ncbi:MAG TPA: hypothetical protein ENN20_00210 [Candidatus Marinimicrobia bacterium]|nr:hypothetical protein [Candidatus Neomarinimicrobiota bacterium]